MKTSNLAWFGWELIERLADLQYTKQRFVAALHATGYPNCPDCLPTRACSKCHSCGVQPNTDSRPEKRPVSKSTVNLNTSNVGSSEDVCNGSVLNDDSGSDSTLKYFNASVSTPLNKFSRSSPDVSHYHSMELKRSASHQTASFNALPSDTDLLTHTNLTNIASQLLDSQKMLSTVREYLVS